MRDQADLVHRAALVKQALLMALKHANSAALDGNRDEQDLNDLGAAFEQVKTAKDALDQLRRRLEFHVELERVRSQGADGESSRYVVALVRRGVDGGYGVEEVRRMVDEALGLK